MASLTTTRRVQICTPTPLHTGGQALNNNFAGLAARAALFSIGDPAFGAVGDGVTDDTVALEACIAAAEAASAGVVFFPDGEYLLKRLPLRRNIRYTATALGAVRLVMRHDGRAATPYGIDLSPYTAHAVPEMGGDNGDLTAFVATDDTDALNAPNDPDFAVTGVVLENLIIDGGGGVFGTMNPNVNPERSYHVVNTLGCPDIVIRDCIVKGAPSEIDISTASNWRSCCLSVMSSAGEGWSITDNEFHGPAAYNCVEICGFYASRGIFARNKVRGGKRAAVQAEYLSNMLQIADNDIENDWQGRPAGYATFSGATYTYSGSGTTGNITKSGHFSNYLVGGAPGTDTAVEFQAGDSVMITAGTGFTPGVYTVTACPNANTITITGGPTSNQTGVGGYQNNSGCGTVLTGNSYGLYFHAVRDSLITGNRIIVSSANGGAALAAFSDFDAEGADYSGATARPFARNIIANNWIMARGSASGILILSPSTAGQTTPFKELHISGNVIICHKGSGIVTGSDSPYKRHVGITITGNVMHIGDALVVPGDLGSLVGTGTAGNLMSIKTCDSLVIRDNSLVKGTTGNHGIVLGDCPGALIEGNYIKGESGNGLAIWFLPFAGVQSERPVIRNNHIDGWLQACTANTTQITQFTFEGNRIENCINALQSYVGSGAQLLQFMGGAPTMGSIRGNWSADATLNSKLRDTNAGGGTASDKIASGASASGAIAHGLASDATVGNYGTLDVNNIQIIPTSVLNSATAVQFRVSAVTATTFTVSAYTLGGVLATVAADFTFNWIARASRGV